ncbi:hypothetical protein [Floridanema aerugineum]|uniref:Uncharacterized protein n=1 Tax=Floridaenema aerugineum BLCC-F46 TaxID=3153654 RepID=A0ABV4X265_9CYAN
MTATTTHKHNPDWTVVELEDGTVLQLDQITEVSWLFQSKGLPFHKAPGISIDMESGEEYWLPIFNVSSDLEEALGDWLVV